MFFGCISINPRPLSADNFFRSCLRSFSYFVYRLCVRFSFGLIWKWLNGCRLLCSVKQSSDAVRKGVGIVSWGGWKLSPCSSSF